jgi:hypothetical protein
LKIQDQDKGILFEHRFWLQVLGDHARMLFKALGPNETNEIRQAQCFIKLFDDLLVQARKKDMPPYELSQLNTTAYNAAQQIRSFKLHLIKRQLIASIVIEFPPSFINHMVNEVEEYLFILGNIMQNRLPVVNPIHHHLVWLLDGSGHAYGIAGALDMVEKKYMEKSQEFAQIFDELYLKAVELCGYMRTNLTQFPSLSQLNKEVDKKMEAFKTFLKELEKLVDENKILGTLYPLILDHMYREECYYITKLSFVSEVETPDCDPTAPRVDG